MTSLALPGNAAATKPRRPGRVIPGFGISLGFTLFYLALIVIPMTGWLASSAGGRAIQWFGLFEWPLLPIGGGREAARGLMAVHGLAVKGLYVLIALHVLAALKHQFIDRDNVLHRMIPLIPRRP